MELLAFLSSAVIEKTFFFFFTVIHTDFKTKIYTKKRHVYYKAGFLVSIQSL